LPVGAICRRLTGSGTGEGNGMSAVRMLAASDIRRSWRSVVALTLLVGAVGAIVLATAAGARRSDTALSRFNASSRSSDVEISIGFPTASQLTAFRRSPGVAAFAYLRAYSLQIKGYENLAIAAPTDSAMGNVVDRVRLIKGRLADPADAGRGHDRRTAGGANAPRGRKPSRCRVVHAGADRQGIQRRRSRRSRRSACAVAGRRDRPAPARPRCAGTVGGVALLTPGFGDKYEGRIGRFTDVLRVKTDAGTRDVPRVIATARKLWGDALTFQVQPLGIETEGANSEIDVLTAALWIFAGVTALAGAVAIGIVLTRDIARAVARSIDAPGPRGNSRPAGRGEQRSRADHRRRGALLAGIGATLASPLLPLGAARRADPNVGLHVDWLVLGLGVTLVAVVVLAIAFVAPGAPRVFCRPIE
jgi:hypothetical protein